MILALVLVVTGVLCVTALGAAIAMRSDRAALTIGTLGAVGGCGVGLVVTIVGLARGEHDALHGTWAMPIGEAHVGIDPLSAFFLVCVFVVSGLAAVYGRGYLRAYIGVRRLAPAVVFFNLLVASMVGLVVARDGILFLVAWEAMTFASFFLVTYESDRDDVRRAGWTYLIASHLGAAVLFVLFLLLYHPETGHPETGFDFDAFVRTGAPPGLASVCFLLALAGFGTKAGFWPVHVWLPDAHPAAPSHVSALMSGVMIKMGIYGLIRALSFLGAPEPWWGAVLVAIGAISGVVGVLLALAQHDLKRLLAYHSVENIGIIALGLGIGVIGQSQHRPEMAFLGYAGALLHVLNHGLFKGLLFQAAGSVLHATGTREIDRLGGLARAMPMTTLLFLVGSVAICGLPPLNGFVSEWLVYLGAFRGGTAVATGWVGWSIAVIPILALIGGLAAACFVKAFSVVFLGTARGASPAAVRDPGPAMIGAMWAGAGLCLMIGVWPQGILALVGPLAAELAGADASPLTSIGSLDAITQAAAAFVGLVVLLALARRWLVARHEVGTGPTWGCGYPAPSSRMQYTAASFAQPLLAPFTLILPSHVHHDPATGFFPEHARYEEHRGDMAGEQMLEPATHWLVRMISRLRVPEGGRVQLYLAYVFVTLVALLLWQLGGVVG